MASSQAVSATGLERFYGSAGVSAVKPGVTGGWRGVAKSGSFSGTIQTTTYGATVSVDERAASVQMPITGGTVETL